MSEQGKKDARNLSAIAAHPDIWQLGFGAGVESEKLRVREYLQKLAWSEEDIAAVESWRGRKQAQPSVPEATK